MISQRRIDEAVALHQAGRLDEATQKYDALLAIEPGNANLLNLTGILAGQRGDYTRALMLLQRAVAANPSAPHYRNSLAVTLERIGNRAGAAAEFNEEGNLLLPLYQAAEALKAFGHALRLEPNAPHYKCNYAVALIKLGRPQEAADLLATTPDENRLSYIPLNLGNALAGLPKPAEAIAAYDRALALEPDMVEAHWARGQMRLLTGDYERGLADYEWRRKWRNFENPYRALPEFHGQELTGKLLVVTEQGYGDTIQFARYVKKLAAEGHEIIFEMPPPLFVLFQEGFACERVEIVARSAMAARMVECAAHIMLLSLPNYFETRADTIPDDTGYLTASAQRQTMQASHFPDCQHKRIGIVRSGQAMHGNDYVRSISALVMQPLLEADADFYSLQISKFDHEDVVDLGLKFQDFADTAAAIMAMDLVISVDTSVAHLAGALGKPVWILIPHAPDWRWGLFGSETAWYPQARLFRQNGPEGWPDVIAAVRAALDIFIEGTDMPEKSAEASQSIAAAEEAIERNPSDAAAYRALAAAHHAAGDKMQAGAVYAQLADAEREGELFAEAADDYASAIALLPPNQHLFNNYGVTLRCLKRNGDAIAAFTRALAIEPGLYSALSNRANMYWETGNQNAAFADHRAAIAAQPDDAQARVNHAVALREIGAFSEALAEYDRAIELAPDFALAHYDRGQLLAQMGDLRAGFGGMEWRFKPGYPSREKLRRYRQPVWRGGKPEDLRGRLLILSEQGLGDTIQFSRYAPLLVARGFHVVLEVQPPLLRLYEESFARPGLRVIARSTGKPPRPRGLAGLLGFGSDQPNFTAYAPMLSLPERFHTTLETIPAAIPYLSVAPAQKAKWAARLKASRGKLKVGLVWQGDPKHAQDKTRSLAPGLLHPLLDDADVAFYALQKGKMADWKFPHSTVTSLGRELHDFYDTAAAIENLDLVITVDTSVAHLAGALGKPVWIMLTKIGEWRWLSEGDTSPWYPTARLFRQRVQGEWDEVIARVADEVKKLK